MSKVLSLLLVTASLLLVSCAGGIPTASIADDHYRIRSLTHDSVTRYIKVYPACYRGNPATFRNSLDLVEGKQRLVLHALYRERNVGASLLEAIITLNGDFEEGNIYQLRAAINKGQITVWAEDIDDPAITTEKTSKKLRFSQLVNLDSELRPLCRNNV